MPVLRFRLSPRPECFRAKRRPPVWLVVGASFLLFFFFMLAAAVIGALMSPEPFIPVHNLRAQERSNHVQSSPRPKKSATGRLRPLAETLPGHFDKT